MITATISILVNDGLGNFAPPVSLATSGRGVDMEAADMNGDGTSDLVIAIREPASSRGVVIMYGDGVGSFGSPQFVPAGPRPHSVTVGDINGDDIEDLAVAHCCGSSDANFFVQVLTGKSDGTFDPPVTYPTGAGLAGSVQAVDLDGDGNLDLVSPLAGASLIAVWLNDGTGSYPASPQYVPTPVYAVLVLDTDLDGRLDLVVTDNSTPTARVLTNQSTPGNLVFSSPVALSLSASAIDGMVGDLDGDGLDDVALTQPAANSVTVLLSRPGGVPEVAGPFPSGGTGNRGSVGDLNGDGAGDIAMTDQSPSGSAAILFNDSDTTPPVVVVSSPVDGAVFEIGEVVPVSYSCSDAGSGVASCVGDVADGGLLGTSSFGSFSFSVTGTDQAGNSVTVVNSYSVSESVPPVVVGVPDRAPDGNGWYQGPVVVSWSVTDPDPSSGLGALPGAVVAGLEGTNSYVSDEVCDLAGNCATGSITLSIDTTPPVISDAQVFPAVIAVGGSSVLTVSADDVLSGISGVEYYIGGDPGPGQGTMLVPGGGGWESELGSGLGSGVHTIGVRAVDRAGNWSTSEYVTLVVFRPSGPWVTGGGWFGPGGDGDDDGDHHDHGHRDGHRDGHGRGDRGGSDDDRGEDRGGDRDRHDDGDHDDGDEYRSVFELRVRYRGGNATTPSGKLRFENSSASGRLVLRSTSLDWLVVSDDGAAEFAGMGKIRGADGEVAFRVVVVDGNWPDRGRRETDGDRFEISIWAPGVEPGGADPMFIASGDLDGGNVQIHRSTRERPGREGRRRWSGRNRR